MTHNSLTVKSLLVLIAFAAIGVAAVKNANAWWAVGLSHLSVFCFLAAAMALFYVRDSAERAFFAGFAVIGIAFFLLNYRVALPELVYETKKIETYAPPYQALKAAGGTNQLGRVEVVTQIVNLFMALLGGFVTRAVWLIGQRDSSKGEAMRPTEQTDEREPD